MDQKVLVNELIEDGEKLLRRLAEEGVSVTAAGWVKEVEDDQWYLYIATPLVDDDGGGIKTAYDRVNTTRRKMPEELALELAGFKLVGPGEPIARTVLRAWRGERGGNRMYFGEGGRRIDGVFVEEVYLYPPEVASASGQGHTKNTIAEG
jgi:hypothetical protein